MPNLGNVWHIPENPEPRGLAGMRSPIGPIVTGTELTICSGNQFQGNGNAGNQLQVGSVVFFRSGTAANWQSVPMGFFRQVDNNKYYSAKIPSGTFQTGDQVEYYLRIPYSDHDATFVHLNGTASVTTGSEAVAQGSPFRFTVEDRAVKGHWGPVFGLPNVAIHSHLLPNGRVLMWGRRNRPEDDLDVQECQPFVWNPADNSTHDTQNQPHAAGGATVNLFCSGHTFLPDGRLLVVGGHKADGDGISQASLYDSTTNQWTASAPMTTPVGQEVRRWYPTATTLPNGSVLVLSGSYKDPNLPDGKQTVIVDLLQVWDDGQWTTIDKNDGAPLNFIGLPLYPRMHVAGDGRVFMSGSNDRGLLLKTVEPGDWTELAFRSLGNRDYCPSVMYAPNQVLYIGGGNDAVSHAPTAGAETIDLGAAEPRWKRAESMHFARRQHNATLLPDGTVLVTGGTRGGGGPNQGFNDLDAGQPVHVAELWDPATEKWTLLAAEDVPRCYHATAVLLPDGTVLSAGGGEYRPDNQNPNFPEDSHRDAQIFSPPYLFKGPQPVITAAPASVGYGAQFVVTTPQSAQIRKVTWLGLSSVTHSQDENQRINLLQFTTSAAGLNVTSPASPNECPPGHYLLFIVDQAGVPSKAKIVQIHAPVQPAAVRARRAASSASATDRPRAYLQVYAKAEHVERTAKGTAVLVGITGTCPYGIGACWGGAYEALKRLEAVEHVGPIPNAGDSTADVFLVDERLPPLEAWRQQFRRIANGSYELRGVEVTVHGLLELHDGELVLARSAERPQLRLGLLDAAHKIQWDHSARLRRPLQPEEAKAFQQLRSASQGSAGQRPLSVTGPLELSDRGYVLQVRRFALTQ
jgi:galactose oxidase